MNKTQTIQQLIGAIYSAFDGVSRAGGVTYHQALLSDDYKSDEEVEAAAALDTETRWQEIPEQDLERACCLFYCNAESYPYYLPAYMIWTLLHIGEYTSTEDEYHDSAKIDRIIYVLRLRHENGRFYNDAVDYRLAQWSLFTPQQGRATANYLCFMAEHNRRNNGDFVADNAIAALNQHWGQFLEAGYRACTQCEAPMILTRPGDLAQKQVMSLAVEQGWDPVIADNGAHTVMVCPRGCAYLLWNLHRDIDSLVHIREVEIQEARQAAEQRQQDKAQAADTRWGETLCPHCGKLLRTWADEQHGCCGYCQHPL